MQEDTKEKASEKKDAEKEIKKIMILIAHDTIMILGIKNIGFRKGLIYQPSASESKYVFRICYTYFRRSDLDTSRDKAKRGDRNKRRSEAGGQKDYYRRTDSSRYERDYRKGYSVNHHRNYRYVEFLMII